MDIYTPKILILVQMARATARNLAFTKKTLIGLLFENLALIEYR